MDIGAKQRKIKEEQLKKDKSRREADLKKERLLEERDRKIREVQLENERLLEEENQRLQREDRENRNVYRQMVNASQEGLTDSMLEGVSGIHDSAKMQLSFSGNDSDDDAKTPAVKRADDDDTEVNKENIGDIIEEVQSRGERTPITDEDRQWIDAEVNLLGSGVARHLKFKDEEVHQPEIKESKVEELKRLFEEGVAPKNVAKTVTDIKGGNVQQRIDEGFASRKYEKPITDIEGINVKQRIDEFTPKEKEELPLDRTGIQWKAQEHEKAMEATRKPTPGWKKATGRLEESSELPDNNIIPPLELSEIVNPNIVTEGTRSLNDLLGVDTDPNSITVNQSALDRVLNTTGDANRNFNVLSFDDDNFGAANISAISTDKYEQRFVRAFDVKTKRPIGPFQLRVFNNIEEFSRNFEDDFGDVSSLFISLNTSVDTSLDTSVGSVNVSRSYDGNHISIMYPNKLNLKLVSNENDEIDNDDDDSDKEE